MILLWFNYVVYELTMIPLTDPRKNFENTIHCFDSKYPEDQLFCELTMIQISASQFTMTILVLNSLWIIFCFTNRLLIHHWFAKLTMNHYYVHEIILNHGLFRELTVNSPPILRIYCGFTIFFANRKRIYYLQRELSVNSLSVLRFNCEFTIYFAN